MTAASPGRGDSTATGASRLPTLYVPHGAGPCFFMDWSPRDTWRPMGDFLRGVVASLPARPTAILMVSAHWEAPRFTVGSGAHPGLLFDYDGFPPHTYDFRYAPGGDPMLASRIERLLDDAGLPSASDPRRAYDHGVFIPLMLMAPAADIPVVQLSLRSGLDPAEHDAVGRALQPLRDEGVLLVGSGMSFHNMRGYGKAAFGPVSDRFDAWLAETVAVVDPDARAVALSRWDVEADGRASHPREEHLLPLMVVAGGAGTSAGRRVFSGRVMETTVSAFRFD